MRQRASKERGCGQRSQDSEGGGRRDAGRDLKRHSDRQMQVGEDDDVGWLAGSSRTRRCDVAMSIASAEFILSDEIV